MSVHPCLHPPLDKQLPGTGCSGEKLRPQAGERDRQMKMLPEPKMVGRALGGRDPVKELVLLLPLLLVPPPLHVSCREESWPGMEMDLAVDGGLERTEGCDWSAPISESDGDRGTPGHGRRTYLMALIPTYSQDYTHVLKQGSPESRNMPMVTYG